MSKSKTTHDLALFLENRQDAFIKAGAFLMINTVYFTEIWKTVYRHFALPAGSLLSPKYHTDKRQTMRGL